MNEEPKSIWKRSIKGPVALAVWLGISTAALFIVIFSISFVSARTTSIGANALGALALSLILVLIATLGLVVLRWLWCWKNLRRLAFALACVVTLIALLYAEENWRGKHAWENYRRQRESLGEKFERADFIPAAVPNEQNFAMTPFLAPMFDFKPGTQEHLVTNWLQEFTTFRTGVLDFEAMEEPRSNSWAWSGDDLAAWHRDFLRKSKVETNDLVLRDATAADLAIKVLAALQRADPVLDEIRTASHRQHARFNIRYENDDPASIILPHLSVMKHLTLVLQLRASVRLTLGQMDEAMDDINLMFYLMEAIHPEPILISQLVRFAQLQLILEPIGQGMETHQWSDAQLKSFQQRFQAFDFCADMQFAMSAERAFFGGGLLEYFRHLNSGQRLHFYEEISQWSDSQSNNADSFWPLVYVSVMPTGWYYREQLNYNNTFDQYLIPLIDVQDQRINPGLVEKANGKISELKSIDHAILRRRLFSKLWLPALPNVMQKTARAQTYANLGAIACGLELFHRAHGDYPDSLSAIVPEFITKLPHDLIDGQQLRYRRQSDRSVLIYSIGWNEKDDGGIKLFMPDPDARSRDSVNQGDWVWQLPGQ